MISMAMFGAFSGALTGNAQRISQEKKDGWIRQLRLTPQTRPAHRGPGRDAGRHGAYRHWYAPVASAGKRGSMDVQAGR
jgi:hypothetical protein